MKKITLLLFLLATASLLFAQTRHPYYGGGKHTTSHGGTYAGSTKGSSHKGGHYVNSKTYDTYGKHKRK
jgi:hypothetical protein